MSSNKGIIRGAKVNGIVFCSPTGAMEREESIQNHEKENLKTLEDFWFNKGVNEGKKQGFEEGFKEGTDKGIQIGKEQGKSEGLEEGKNQGLEEGFWTS